MTQREAVGVSGFVRCCELRQLVNMSMSQRMRLTPPAGRGLKYTSHCPLPASYVLHRREVAFRAGQHQARADGQAYPLFRPDAAQAGTGF